MRSHNLRIQTVQQLLLHTQSLCLVRFQLRARASKESAPLWNTNKFRAFSGQIRLATPHMHCMLENRNHEAASVNILSESMPHSSTFSMDFTSCTHCILGNSSPYLKTDNLHLKLQPSYAAHLGFGLELDRMQARGQRYSKSYLMWYKGITVLIIIDWINKKKLYPDALHHFIIRKMKTTLLFQWNKTRANYERGSSYFE